jgi:threonine synthase
MDKLECVFCGKKYPLNIFSPFCPACREPLLVSYTKKKRGFHFEKNLAIDVFEDFLPLDKIDSALSLGEGDTPLLELRNLSKIFDLPLLYGKNESVNPTASFKDRGTAVAIQKAVSLGFRKIGTVSTGNMAGSTAAYAARAGSLAFVFVKEDTSKEKILAAGIHGAKIFRVRGNYRSLFDKSFEIGRKRGIYFMNSVDPFRIEGYKVTAYEVFLQLGWKMPQYIFIPVSAGGHIIGFMRGFDDLKAAGLIRKYPIFIGVQALGCAPLARAFAAGRLKFTPFLNPKTVAHAISNPDPPGGNIVLKMIRERGGILTSVTDADILRAQSLLAKYEGIFCDPASATVMAALLALKRKMVFEPSEKLVLVITGSGLKTLEDLDAAKVHAREAELEGLEDLF